MVIEEALYYHLSNDAGVSALVSTRIYPLAIPQDVSLPACAYQRISGQWPVSHSAQGIGIGEGRFQITCQAQGYDTAKAVAKAVRDALIGYKGMMGGPGGIMVDGCFMAGEIDGYGMTAGVYTVREDVIVRYRE